MHARRAKLILAAIPVGLFVLSAILTQRHGPFFLRNNFDPEYNYLLNSLSLLTGHAPAHTDHPGTTLQILGAGVIWLQWLGGFLLGHRQALSDSVLSHPEPYLLGMNIVLNVLISGALYWSASSVYRSSRSLIAALALQATVLVYLQNFIALTRVSPEPLLVAVGLALMVPIAPMVLHPEGIEPDGNRLAVAAGAIFGFGLITKVTFAPWAAVILLFPKRIYKRRFMVAALIAIVVLLLPITVRLPAVASWFVSLLVHTGQYGEGRIGIPGVRVLVANFLSLWPDQLPLFGFLALYAAALLLSVISKDRVLLADRARPLLWTACVAIVAETIMVMKHPAARYLLPALILTAFANSALYAMAPGLIRPVLAALIAVGLLCNGFSVRWWVDAARDDRQNLAALRGLEDRSTECRIIGSYRSSLKGYALSFASDYSAGVHSKILEKLYPGAIHYDPFRAQFLSFAWDQRKEDVKRLISSGHCVLMETTPLATNVLQEFLDKDRMQFTPLMTVANPLSPGEPTVLYRLQLSGLP